MTITHLIWKTNGETHAIYKTDDQTTKMPKTWPNNNSQATSKHYQVNDSTTEMTKTSPKKRIKHMTRKHVKLINKCRNICND